MRVDEMIVREDFFKILADTVIEYYRLVCNRDVVFSYKKVRHSEKLLINGKLGFVTRFPTPNGVRTFLMAEYNIRGSRLKFLAGKVIAWFVGRFPQVGKVRNAYISTGALGRNTFISPQNRSVRFFDYDAMTVDCIIKNGFTSKYFSNQLEFRKINNYDFMLPMLDSGDKWFREPILTGHPLVRITDEVLYQKATADALVGIAKLAEDTITYEDSAVYVQALMSKIQLLIEEATQKKQITYGTETLQMVQQKAQLCMAHPMQIPLCTSHGDFQGGNIWVDQNEKTWIYDWETVGRRSIWYDSAVLCYSLRRAYGWQSFYNDKVPTIICACDPQKVRTEEEFNIIKAVVFLEDVVFYLEDMLELPEDWGAQIYDVFAKRMWELLKDC